MFATVDIDHHPLQVQRLAAVNEGSTADGAMACLEAPREAHAEDPSTTAISREKGIVER
jgi:hypothetical protein